MRNTGADFGYRILVKGHLSDLWLNSLPGFRLKRLGSGNSRISGRVEDDAAFYGVLGILRDMGVTILKINRKAYRNTRKGGRNNTNTGGGVYVNKHE